MPTIDEYMAAHPEMTEQPAPETEEVYRNPATLRKDHQEASRLMESISLQLEQGNAPQMILYTALRCIGLFSHDPDWAADQEAQLDRIYGDLMQESLLVDNTLIAQERHKAMAAEYNERATRQLKKQLAGYKKIMQNLGAALNAIEDMESQSTGTTDGNL